MVGKLGTPRGPTSDMSHLIYCLSHALAFTAPHMRVARRAVFERYISYPDSVVRMRGLEPPLPCENMDLNHARLPIPPHPHN
jgi:hypothetical protein